MEEAEREGEYVKEDGMKWVWEAQKVTVVAEEELEREEEVERHAHRGWRRHEVDAA